MKISCITSISKISICLCAIKTKKHYCRYFLQCFSSEEVLQENKKVCLEINGK